MLGDPFQILLILGVLATILIWGPNKIPELAKSLGKARRTFENASRGIEEVEIPESPLIRTAHELGIDTKGKTKAEIINEISEK
jgi:sec-independent protein translocase protein TatA